MNNYRRKTALERRQLAAQMAHDRPHPRHLSNSEEQRFRHKEDSEIAKCHKDHHKGKITDVEIELKGKPSYLMSFTKGMPHNFDSGLLNNPLNYQYFIRAIDSGDPRDFRDTPLGPDEHVGKVYNCPPSKNWKSIIAQTGKKDKNGNDGPVGLRAWESQSAGLAYDLEGPDAQAVTMPPAPSLGSDELTAEMAEIYAQALTRDVPFNALSAGLIEKDKLSTPCDKLLLHAVINQPELSDFHADKDDVEKFIHLTNELKKLKWFSEAELKLNAQEEARRCNRQCPIPTTAFRGITKGDDVGPYLSQFLLIGNSGFDGERNPADGLINYGANSIDQRVRVASPQNYMTKWEQWFDVQNAAAVGGMEAFDVTPARRFIYTPRDLATYVHYDALYEAYLNACLIMLSNGVKFDPGIPFQDDDSRDHQQGFAHFGGPHILSLVTEVATRALKAVRFQKYNIHRRCRPEVLGARLTKAKMFEKMAPELLKMVEEIGDNKKEILGMINDVNGDLYQNPANGSGKNFLLPMAFTEGSPMHPAYGAGHATVAGACVTILKAFFDCNSIFKPNGTDSNKAYVSVDKGEKLELIPVKDRNGHDAHLTIEGELNKLASNISIGRNWAGVHYFTDYYESILMGEQIAIAILEEQKLMFGENFSFTLPMFGGDTIRI